jgi:2-methylcitrate dehydratase PrpD
MPSVLQRLAARIEGTGFKDLPPDVVREVKRHLLDVLGVLLAGHRTAVGERITAFVKGLKASVGATIVGDGEKVAPFYAVLANASAGFHLELDDVHRTSHTHPGITTIPAALAIAETTGATGMELISAINAGYETEIRIGQAVSPSVFLDRVVLPASLLGSFGASAAACRLLRLTTERTTDALANVATLTPLSIFETYKSGTAAKEFMMGWTASVGLLSALMAKGDIGGPATAMEGPLGFAKAAADRFDQAKIDHSGPFYRGILETGMKPYACCRQHHSAVDAALELRREHNIRPEDVLAITDSTFSVASRGSETAPATVAAAKYSAPFVIAVALAEGKVWREQFTEEKIRDKGLLDLAGRVTVRLDQELDRLYDEKWPSLVEIRTKDGRVYSARHDLPKGEPEKALTDKDVEEKFISLATDTLSERDARDLMEMVSHIEDLENAGEIVSRLVGVRK